MKHSIGIILLVASLGGCIFGGGGPIDPSDTAMPDVGGSDATVVDTGNNVTPDMGPDMSGEPCDLVVCEDGAVCDPASGRCTSICEPTQRFCGDACVNVGEAIEHCGACDRRCDDFAPENAHTRFCANSQCQFECDSGWSDLNGDLQDADSNGCELECLDTMIEAEICDGLDNDCNGMTDDGLDQTTYYVDGDGDGFGDPNNTTRTCATEPPVGYIRQGGDCDDSEGSINPGATEECDGVDGDCDPNTDDADNPDCVHTVFITSTAYIGDFGPDGPDALCEAHGGTFGNEYKSWRAIAFDGTEAPFQRIQQIGAIHGVSGEVLWDAGMMFLMPPQRAINVTESGSAVSASAASPVWTGSRNNGTRKVPHCMGWTTDTGLGTIGSTRDRTAWLNDNDSTRMCDTLARLYCINGQDP